MILDFFSQLLTMLESFFAPFIMILKYLYNDTKRKVQPFQIGVFTIFLVIG